MLWYAVRKLLWYLGSLLIHVIHIMEAEHLSKKDDLSTSTTTPHMSSESGLKLDNWNPDNDYGDTFDGDPSLTSNPSDNDKDNATSEQSDLQNVICDNNYLQRTKCDIKSDKNSDKNKPCKRIFHSLDSARKYHSDSEELGNIYEKQGSSSLYKSNSLINLKISSRKETHNNNGDDLTCVSNSSADKNKDCVGCNVQGCQNYHPISLSDINTNSKSSTLNLCDDISNCKLKKAEKEFSLVEKSDSIIHEVSQNIGDESSLKKYNIINSNKINEGSTLPVNITSLNYNSINSPNAATLPSSKKTQKTVTFDRNQSPPKKYQRTVQSTSSSEIRRLSRTRLSQWGSRNKKTPIDIQTSLPIVEGMDDRHLWTEAISLNGSALLVLWWTLLAIIMYILSFYDLWADCSVAYFFYQKDRYPEYRWCIISLIVLVNSYFLQCCFSYYEVTHALHDHFGPLGSKKYSIPLFFFMPWIIVSIGIYDTYKNKYTRRLETAYIMMFIEVIFESLAQTSLQLNAICVYAHEKNETVSVLQWCSVSSSILFLSIGISYSVIFYNNKDATQWIKFTFCVFGGITIVSRLLLCSSWALQDEILWAVPFLAGLFTTSLTWLILRTFTCFGYKEFLTKYDIKNLPMALVTSSSWVTSFAFNCFSPSGIPVSVLMCVLAGVDFYIKEGQLPQFDKTLQIVNVCLTIFVLLCNLVFSFVPQCRILSHTWIEGEGEDEDDPYHFRFY